MKAVILALVATVFLSSTTTIAFAESGNDLLRECSKKAGSNADGYCHGFIWGTLHGVNEATIRAQEKKYVCIPQGVTISQLTRLTKKYLEENPQKLHLLASTLIVNAVTTAYPCR